MLLKLRDAARKGDLTAFVPPRFPSARRAASAVNAYSAADEDEDDAHDPNYVAGQQTIRAFTTHTTPFTNPSSTGTPAASFPLDAISLLSSPSILSGAQLPHSSSTGTFAASFPLVDI